MPRVVEVPGHGDVEFPDGMDDAAIVAAIEGLNAPARAPSSNPATLPGNKPKDSLGGPPRNTNPTYGERVARGASTAILGPTGGGIGETLAQPIIHPVETIKSAPGAIRDIATGNPEAIGQALATAPFAAYGGQLSRTMGPVIKAAAKSGIEALPQVVPAAAGGATIGEAAGYATGHGHSGAIPGAMIGGSIPIIRGAARGVRQALSEQMPTPTHSTPNPSPQVIPPSRQLGPASTIIPSAPSDTSGVIKGWKPTILEKDAQPIHAATPDPPHVPLQQPRFDPLNPLTEGERNLVSRRRVPYGQEQAAPISTPAPPKPTIDQLIQNARTSFEQKGIVPPGYRWGHGDAGNAIRPRFDEGSGAPIIQAPKTTIATRIPSNSPLLQGPNPLERLKAAKALADAMK